jgi:hypothetical protein
MPSQNPRRADEHRAPAAAAAPALPAPSPVFPAVAAYPGEDDPRHDGQPQDDRAVERLAAGRRVRPPPRSGGPRILFQGMRR